MIRDLFVTVMVALTVATSLQATSNRPLPSPSAEFNKSLNAQEIPFIKNVGQWPDSILFSASVGSSTLWFTGNGIWYEFFNVSTMSDEHGAILESSEEQINSPNETLGFMSDSVEILMIKAEFVASNESVEVLGVDELGYKCNYFLGNNQSQWRTNVPTYSSVLLKEIYEGIDIKYTTSEGRLTEETIRRNNGNTPEINVRYLSASGETLVTTPLGAEVNTSLGVLRFEGALLTDNAESKDEHSPIASASASGGVGVGLIYSTYLRGNVSELATGITVDSGGNSFVTGYTLSANFPVSHPFQPTYSGDYDAFVTKLNSSGNGLVYSTYLGGEFTDYATGITVDDQGNVYVTGYTYSPTFPTKNPFKATTVGYYFDAFVSKISSSGDSLVYSTYLGGDNGHEYARGITVDQFGCAYVTGRTAAWDFPTQVPFQAEIGGGWDAFVTKFSTTGESLVYSTFLGGSSDDRAYGIIVDSVGNVFASGTSTSTNFPTQGSLVLPPFQNTNHGMRDAFIAKLTATGNSLIYSTFLGGSGEESCLSITVDDEGSALVAGQTFSSDFPLMNSLQPSMSGGSDSYATKLNNTGTELIFSTYIGGSGTDISYGVTIDDEDNAVVAGITSSTDFSAVNSFQPVNLGGNDAFVAKIKSNGDGFIYSTYLGGSGGDVALGIALDNFGNAYIIGQTTSDDFPVKNPFQSTRGSGPAAFVSKFSAFDLPTLELRIDGDTNASHVVSQNPVLEWNHRETGAGAQLAFEIAVGTDQDWPSAEMWSPAINLTADSIVTYAGATLVDGRTYFVRLRVDNGLGWSTWSQYSFRMNSLPSIPGQLFPVLGAATSTTPTLWIENATDAEGDSLTYDFQGHSDSTCVGAQIEISQVPQMPDSTRAVAMTPLGDNCVYWWQVRSHDGYEYSAWSPLAMFSVDATPDPPTAPHLISPPDLLGSPTFNLTPTFYWSRSSDTDPNEFVRYRLEIATTPDFIFVNVMDAIVDTSYYLTDSLAFSKRYWWKVSAYDKTNLRTYAPTVKNFLTWKLGDMDRSNSVNIVDLTAMVAWLFNNGPAPQPTRVADVDGSCATNVADITYLVQFLFRGGPDPQVGCDRK